MRIRPKGRGNRGNYWLAVVVAVLLALPLFPGFAQTVPSRFSAVPQWETDAGGKMSFDVASVKQNKSGLPPSGAHPSSNFPLDPGPTYFPSGGLFTATNQGLNAYIAFAYKLDPIQVSNAMSGEPAWAKMDRFDIQARAEGNPTKDQMRLMMQALLADRFKLALHTETKQMPFYALVLAAPGRLGPQLKPHSDDPLCPDINNPPRSRIGDTTELPASLPCGGLQIQQISGRLHPMARGLSLPVLASDIEFLGRLDHPVLDRTGLSGTFDLTIDYVPQPDQPGSATADAEPSDDSTPPSLTTALQEQLGLRLERQTGPVDVLVIDHVEQPSEN